MWRFPRAGLPIVAALAATALPAPAPAEVRDLPTGAFTSELQVTLAGSPETVYDAVTGDVSGWWDHSFSEKPYRFFLEAKPGGGFYEIFDAQGNGVRHATVIYADRGKLLRMEGPLGLSGHAVSIVTTYAFAAVGDSTRFTVTVHGSGEMDPGWPALVDQVWRHFIVERFQPWFESGGYRTR